MYNITSFVYIRRHIIIHSINVRIVRLNHKIVSIKYLYVFAIMLFIQVKYDYVLLLIMTNKQIHFHLQNITL